MGDREVEASRTPRQSIEAQIGADLRALTAASEHIGRIFAAQNHLHPTDFRALQHIMVADTEGRPLMASELAGLLGISSAALTYLTERMTAVGHVRRESDANDRRKTLLRYNESAMEVARDFFGPLGARLNSALIEFSDDDLETTHRVMTTLVQALRDHAQNLADNAESNE